MKLDGRNLAEELRRERAARVAAEARVGELEKIIAEGMKWGVNGADAYSATEANKTGEAMRKALRDGGKETK